MGNIVSSGGNGRRRYTPIPHQQEITPNRYVFAAETPYLAQYPNSNHPNPQQYHKYLPGGFYPPRPSAMLTPLPTPYDHHHRSGAAHVDPGHWRYPRGSMLALLLVRGAPGGGYYAEDVNLKKESLRLEADDENPGKCLVSFMFDAAVAGSITVIFFAKEVKDCNLTPTRENLTPVTVQFQQGLGQKFRQSSGTGIDFSIFEEKEFQKEGNMDVYPLKVKAEAYPVSQNGPDGNSIPGPANSQITQSVFEKEKGEYQVRVVEQILWLNGKRYELLEIYRIGNSVDGNDDTNNPG